MSRITTQIRVYIIIMSRISRYQKTLLNFLQTKSFINKTTDPTKIILNDLLKLSDNIPAILCLTILNNQCKKCDLKIHGYYIASGIDIIMLIAKVCNNRDHFNGKYGADSIDNMITEVIGWFYQCIAQNIETLRLSKNGKIDPKIALMCMEYAIKYLPQITQKHTYNSDVMMKKTDILCFDLDSRCLSEYRKKNKLDRTILKQNIDDTYGSVCKLAICLGWIVGQGADHSISHLEKLGEKIGMFLKIYDDFKYLERDILNGKISFNFIVNYGIKEAYNELIEAKTDFIEESMKLGVETKTCKEIMDMIVKDIDNMVKDISVDMETQYDDVSMQ